MSDAPLTTGLVDWDALAPSPVADGITARTFVGAHLSSTTFELAPGAVIPRHAHPNEELGIVLRGGLRMRCGDTELTLHAGDTFFVAPDTAHEGVALDGGCSLLECYSPPRIPAPASEETPR